MELDAKIEALLYFKAEPVSFKLLAEILAKSEKQVREAVDLLKSKLEGRGLTLIIESDSAELRTAPDASSLIESLIKQEDSKELTKSSLETLSIILYKGPISRRDIDFIRGVNSSFILRTLSSRGLIKKASSSGRENIYEATTDLFAHLGISKQSDLPEFGQTIETLDQKVSDLISQGNE